MKLPFRTLLPSVLLASAALLTGASARAEDDGDHSTVRAKFSDPAKPGTLRLILPSAEATIVGTDDPEIVVTSSLDEKSRRNEVDEEGFRRLDEDLTFEVVEKNNVATVSVVGDNAWKPNAAEFQIKVPRNTNLVVRTELGGEIHVTAVEGDLDINTMNGEVTLEDIGSSAVVNTMNGEIHARFKQAPSKLVSLSSMNGEIDVSLPAGTKANLRMRTHNGSIRTNFPAGALQAKTEKGTAGSADLRAAQKDHQRDMASLQRDMAAVQAEVDRATAMANDMAADAVRNAQAAAMEAPDAPPTPSTGQVAAPAPVPAPNPRPIAMRIPPLPPMPNFGGKSIVGTLNGGGVDIKLTSMNGTITLREAK